jgi:hypothetical protein
VSLHALLLGCCYYFYNNNDMGRVESTHHAVAAYGACLLSDIPLAMQNQHVYDDDDVYTAKYEQPHTYTVADAHTRCQADGATCQGS